MIADSIRLAHNISEVLATGNVQYTIKEESIKKEKKRKRKKKGIFPTMTASAVSC
jgi:hypothetical protein